MSHFSTVKTKYTRKKILLQALAKMGLSTTEHKVPVALKSKWGDRATAHLVVDRAQLNSGVDIGFSQQDGAYHLIADDYDVRRSRFPQFRQDLSTEYAILLAVEQGMRLVSRQSSNGRVQLTLTQGV